MRRNRIAVACILLVTPLFVMACRSSKVDLDYQARVDDINFDLIRASEPVVSIGHFEDSRSEGPNRFGTIRGGFGNVLKTISAKQPVVDSVKRAFRSGIKLHGQLSEDGPGRVLLTADLKRLDTNMFMVPVTKIEIDVTVSDYETDVVRFSDTFSADRSGSRPGGLGVNASAYEIKAFTELVLTDLVNEVVSDERFLQALR